MKKRILAILLVLTLTLSILSGCGSDKAYKSLPFADMKFDLANASSIEVKEFNLGEGIVKNSDGEALPCPLTGLLAAPEGNAKCPVVIAIHGYQAENDIYKDPNYQGFDYLLKQLAAEGYLALSINMNLEYNDYQYGGSENFAFAKAVLAQYVQALEKASLGQDVGFEVNLSERADLDNIYLV